MRVRVLGLVAAMALVAGCGSTVADARRPAGQAAAQVSDNLEAGPGDTSVDAAGGGNGNATSAGVSGGSTGTAKKGTATGNTTATARPSTAVGKGITADKIYLGLAYATNSGAANAALGVALSAGDPKRTAEILIEDINSHGGVAGRKLEAVFHEVDGTTTDTVEVISQQTCDDWTQDHQVFVGFYVGTDTMLQCMHNRGALLISDDLTSADAATFRRYPYFVEVGSLNLDRQAASQVEALNAQGYFAGWDAVNGAASPVPPKVGILTFDSPEFTHATDQVLVPALAKLGKAPAAEDIRRIAPNARPSDAGPTAAAVSSAVLKLRSDGVTHVILFDERGLMTLLFLQNAEAQGYRPRYALTSQNGPQALVDGSGLPKRQLIGSKGIGWIPSLDIPPAQNPRNGPYSNDARRRCYDLLTSKGQSFSDVNAESIAMGLCTSLWFFRDTVKVSGNVLNRDGFMSGVAKLGTSFQAAGIFATRFTATQHDGIAAIRYYVYDDGCGCMKYTSGNINAP